MPAEAAQIARIINMSITTASFPLSWKVDQVVPVFKKENRADCNNRPITLLPLLSKTKEHVVHQQLKSYLQQQHILHPVQHGFRSKRSCCSAFLDLSCHLATKKNNRQYQSITALDYIRAFDTINHSILLHKMATVGFDANAL